MSWASERETTRIEDIAYSLLGIFDVNMPLLYGEGNRAFIRLQEEIMKSSNDQTLFAWHNEKNEPSLKPFIGILAESPKSFRRSAEYSPIPTDPETFSSHVMTNNGLQIRLPILSPNYIGLLRCVRRAPSPAVVGVPLIKFESLNTWVRSGAHELGIIPYETAVAAKQETIFLARDESKARTYDAPQNIETVLVVRSGTAENLGFSIYRVRNLQNMKFEIF